MPFIARHYCREEHTHTHTFARFAIFQADFSPQRENVANAVMRLLRYGPLSTKAIKFWLCGPPPLIWTKSTRFLVAWVDPLPFLEKIVFEKKSKPTIFRRVGSPFFLSLPLLRLTSSPYYILLQLSLIHI